MKQWQHYDANARFAVQPAFNGLPSRFVVYDRLVRADVTADGSPLVFHGEAAALAWVDARRRSGKPMTLR